MSAANLLAFALVALVTVVTPGPTVLLALNNGSRHGLRIAAMGILGAVLSDFVLIAAVALGLGALLAASELAFSVLKWLGVVYLAFLGLQLLRARRQAAPEALRESGPVGPRAVFLKSLLVALSNPKGLLFFSALLPQFINPTTQQGSQYLALACTFAAIDAVVMTGYALLGACAMGRLQRSGALWLDRVCGGTLLALAASLAVYRRAPA